MALTEAGYKNEANVLVPHCVYRAGCPEFESCGFWDNFVKACEKDNVNIFDIQQRYDKYTKVLKLMYEKNTN